MRSARAATTAGLTFNTSKPIFELLDGCNNHGHVKVGADGTVYVPMNNSCQGHQGVSLSIDAGETWHFVQVPGTVNGRWDSSIAIANDGRTIYYGYGEQGDDRPMIIKGTLDKSDAAHPDDRLAGAGRGRGRARRACRTSCSPTVVAGDPDRAAFAFHGTTTEGDSGDMATFPRERGVAPVRRHHVRRRPHLAAPQRHAQRSDPEGLDLRPGHDLRQHAGRPQPPRLHGRGHRRRGPHPRRLRGRLRGRLRDRRARTPSASAVTSRARPPASACSRRSTRRRRRTSRAARPQRHPRLRSASA